MSRHKKDDNNGTSVGEQRCLTITQASLCTQTKLSMLEDDVDMIFVQARNDVESTLNHMSILGI